MDILTAFKNLITGEENRQMTVLDYGATLYKTKEDAVNGVSSHQALQSMLDETGCALLPAYGWIKLDDTVILFKEGDCVKSLGGSNKGLNIISTKPISMFLPIEGWQVIQGFTAWYVGDKITEECAVVRLGGDDRNTGGIYMNWDTQKYEKRWPRRTKSNKCIFDFDFIGDRHYYYGKNQTSPYADNPNFVKGGNAHAFWIDFGEENESDYSFWQGGEIRGRWQHVNTGIKITRKKPSSQTINTFDIKVKIDGAKQYAFIEHCNHGDLEILGQDMMNLDDDEKATVRPFEITGGSIRSDIYIYDLTHDKWGNYFVDGLDVTGFVNKTIYNDIRPFRLHNTNLNDSRLMNHSWLIE